MTNESLKIISDAMESMGLHYEFMEYHSKPAYPYFVGEYQETEPMNEDGMQESEFILTGFTRKSWLELETAKTKIKTYFPQVGGRTVITDSGSAVAVFFSNSFPVRTGDAELKKMQIILKVMEWKEQ